MAEPASDVQAQFRELGAQSRARFDRGLAVMAAQTVERFEELRELLWRFSSMQKDVDPAATKQAVWDEHVRAVVLLQELRRLNRKMHVAPLDLMSPVGRAREHADLTTLTYQDKLYLKHYIQALIRAEREDGTNEHRALLAHMPPEEDFLRDMQQRGVPMDAVTSNPHELMLKRLEHEASQRRELMHRAEELSRRLDVIVAISDSKAKTLAGLEPKVDSLLAVCTEAMQGAGGSEDLVGLLPDHLYSTYTHLAACIRAHDLAATVSIQGSAADARAYSQAGQELNPTKADMIKPFPLSVDIALRASGHQVVLHVQYLPHLDVLVVGGKDTLRDGRAASLVPSHWATSALLDEVYPDDRGRRLPFDARVVADSLDTVGASVDDVIKSTGGRPYCWAQWLAGPDMVHRQTGRPVTMSDTAHRQHVQQVPAMVQRRMEALSALYRQLAAMAGHQLDFGPLAQARLKELFPLKSNSTLNKFSLLSDKHSLEFSGYLANGDYELELRIKVPIDYPNRLPEYSLSLRKGVAEGDTPWCLRHMEHEVNTAHGLAWDPPSRNYILTLQMRRLQEVFDAYVRIVQATVDDSVLGRLYERRTKGRDRRMPTRFSHQLRQYVFDQ